MQWSGLTGPEFDALGAAAFTLPAHAAVFELIVACGGVSTAGRARDWAAALRDAAPDDVVRGFVTELAVEPLQMSGEPDEKYADVVLARVGELAAGADRRDQGPAAADEPGGGPGRLRPRVRRAGGA